MDHSIITSLEDKILKITLNRPDKLNSLTDSMARQLQEEFKKAEENSEVRCVLLTGSGKAFCAGQDLPEVLEKGKNHNLGDTVRKNYNPIIKAIRGLEKPVVCAVNGTAAGAGANIAFACDLVIAAESAVFVQAFSKIGLIPDSGGTFFLPRLVGLQRSNILYLLDEKITSQKAVEIGLIYKTVKPDKLMNESEQICQKLTSMPTKGFGLYKRALNQSFGHTLEEQLELEAKLQTEAGKTRDYREGVQAFLKKRKPRFNGR
jgi:2-(1,2-epoxy-1,2-dihydrophenyl)acetyl-CoA isomerase